MILTGKELEALIDKCDSEAEMYDRYYRKSHKKQYRILRETAVNLADTLRAAAAAPMKGETMTDKSCDNCANAGRPSYADPCASCRTANAGTPSGWEAAMEPITNADGFRRMPDDDLARMLAAFCVNAENCVACPMDGRCPGDERWQSWLEWLGQHQNKECVGASAENANG